MQSVCHHFDFESQMSGRAAFWGNILPRFASRSKFRRDRLLVSESRLIVQELRDR